MLLDAGSGGLASQRLISSCFQKHFTNPILNTLDDAALLNDLGPRLAVSTDSYTVTPLFFPGGSIGSLAIHGTVNDVSMLGASPKYLTVGFILEDGLPLNDLEAIVLDMANAAKRAQVLIVTGDTKVVPKGACDKLFINTAGLGTILVADPPSGHKAKVGDVVLVSGAMGDHGLTIMASREDLSFISDVQSDSAPLNHMVFNLMTNCSDIHVLRDPTRGGLATTLNEIALQSDVGIEIHEDRVPIHESVKSGCSFMGLDPLYLANEGKCICIVPKELANTALDIMHNDPLGHEAAIIGQVTAQHQGQVILHTPIGGTRILGLLEGAQLPRIC